jgi:hypothetical protein
MVEIAHCNICSMDIYVNDTLQVGKDELAPEVVIHLNKQTHRKNKAALEHALKLQSRASDKTTSIVQSWQFYLEGSSIPSQSISNIFRSG